jgi:hypothetical protein
VRSLRRAAPLVFAALLACDDSSDADFSGLRVALRFPGAWPVTRAAVRGDDLDGGPGFARGEVNLPAPEVRTATRSATFPVLLPASLAGARLRVHAEVIDADGVVLDDGSDEVRLELGVLVTASVALGLEDR